MKKWLLNTLCLGMVSFLGAQEAEINVLKVVNIFDVTQEEIDQAISGKKQADFILQIPDQAIIPLDFLVEGNICKLLKNSGNYKLEIQKGFYLRWIDNQFYFSSDLSSWKSFIDFFKGSFGIGLQVNEEGPFIPLKAEINKS